MRVLQKTVNLCKCCLTKLNVLLSIALLSCWSCWCSVFTSSKSSPWHTSLINQTPNIIPHKYTVAMLFLVLLSSLQSYLCKDRRLDTDCLQHGTFPLYICQICWTVSKDSLAEFWLLLSNAVFFLFSSDALLNIATNIWITFGDYNGVKLVSKINNIPCTYR